MSEFAPLLPDRVRSGLTTKTLGQVVHHLDVVRSTNETARELAGQGAVDGTLVLAEEQTAGRGRFGRQWASGRSLGVWASIVLRPSLAPEAVGPLGLVAGLSIVGAIAKVAAIRALLRWPNDVLIGERKVCGVLGEVVGSRGGAAVVVLGIGVNVNQCAGDFPKELRETATSLAMECGRPVSRVDVLRAFLHRFEADYFTFLRGGLGPLESSLRRHSALLGRRIRVETGTQEFCGEALDLDPLGRLVVRVEGGGIRTLSSGEVRLVR